MNQDTATSPERVILFTRYPEPGRTKTRLIPALGMEGAADLQRRMTEDIFSQLKVLQQHRTVNLEVRYDGGNRNDMQQWLRNPPCPPLKNGGINVTDRKVYHQSPDNPPCKRLQGAGDARHRPVSYTSVCEQADNTPLGINCADSVPGDRLHINLLPQGGGNLGSKLQRCFADAFSAKMKRVVIVGADCPALSAEIIKKSLDMLGQNDLVLGPAHDGGYYLIGLSRSFPSLFDNIAWGTDQVLDKTLSCAKEMNLTISLLETLADVDRPEDIQHFSHYSRTE